MSTPVKIRFYSAWFCPYAQRAWMVLNNLGISYTRIESLEIDEASHAYKKNSRLLEINPKGLVPTLEVFESGLSDRGENVDLNGTPPHVVIESIDVMKYLYEYTGKVMTASEISDANRANVLVCSPFYRCLIKQVKEEQVEAWNDLTSGLEQFVKDIGDRKFYKNNTANIVDFTVYPWAFRLYVLEEFRGFHLDQSLPWVQLFIGWKERMENEVTGVKETLPDKSKLLQSYERYANATAKSLVGNAVKAGKEAHDI